MDKEDLERLSIGDEVSAEKIHKNAENYGVFEVFGSTDDGKEKIGIMLGDYSITIVPSEFKIIDKRVKNEETGAFEKEESD